MYCTYVRPKDSYQISSVAFVLRELFRYLHIYLPGGEEDPIRLNYTGL